MIKAAAILVRGQVITEPPPARHWHLLKGMADHLYDRTVSGIIVPKTDIQQGFVDDEGGFLSRAAAYKHASMCGQLHGIGRMPGTLFSEDLW